MEPAREAKIPKSGEPGALLAYREKGGGVTKRWTAKPQRPSQEGAEGITTLNKYLSLPSL